MSSNLSPENMIGSKIGNQIRRQNWLFCYGFYETQINFFDSTDMLMLLSRLFLLILKFFLPCVHGSYEIYYWSVFSYSKELIVNRVYMNSSWGQNAIHCTMLSEGYDKAPVCFADQTCYFLERQNSYTPFYAEDSATNFGCYRKIPPNEPAVASVFAQGYYIWIPEEKSEGNKTFKGCEGSNLVTLESLEKHNFVMDFLKTIDGVSYAWIGLERDTPNDEPFWNMPKGERIVYTNNLDPSYLNTNQTFGSAQWINGTVNLVLNDDVTNVRNYVCEVKVF